MKKLLFTKLLVVFSALALVGCGEWAQDPLADARGPLGSGQSKPNTKPEKPALDPSYITMTVPRFKLLREGQEEKIQITARVNLPGYTLSVEVRNLSQFPGATFDETTLTFKWTPPIGPASTEMTTLPLEFIAVATMPGAAALMKQEITEVGVMRKLAEPTITDVTSVSRELRERQTDYFYVTVDDQTAGKATNQYPTLFVRNASGLANLSAFVKVGAPYSLGNSKFEFLVTVDLSHAELTKSRSSMGFALVPISQHQKSGVAREVRIDVLNQMVGVTSTWSRGLSVVAGSTIDHEFLVFDPKQEGKITLEMVDSLPTGASLTCRPGAMDSTLACHFFWTVPVDGAGSYSFRAEFENESTDPYDQHSEFTLFDYQVNVSRGSN